MHLPKISITVVPHHKQRYDTCGDYFKKGGILQVRISKMNDTHEFLVLIHELVEWYLTQKKGVTIKDIDDFDLNFIGKEPGENTSAPYYEEHQFASQIEHLVADKLGVNWEEYDKHVNSL